MRTQLIISPDMPCPEKMLPVQNGDSHNLFCNKPQGGIWTSTRSAPGRSEWVEWCESEMPQWLENTRRWALDIKKGTRLFVVQSKADVARLPRNNYTPFRMEPDDARRPIDFEMLAQDYDGLRIVSRYIDYHLFNFWDVESTVWFRWVFRNVREDV